MEIGQATWSPLANLQFRYPLRRYQKEIIELVNLKLERGEKELHIVAPPGAGKTIIGLQIISQFKCNSLVLCPNTTIQSQWAAKAELFLPPELEGFGTGEFIGTHEDRPLKPITLLTYQVLSTPGREQEYLEKLARQSWVEEMCRGMSLSAGEAELRILELMQNNPRAFAREISRHVTRLRRKLTDVMDLNDVLHTNALELLQALRRQRFELVLFDECHHLTDYWAAVMTHLVKRLNHPVIVGLTGTPPEGKSASQENRYLSLVGDIDYQVPTPALVREGGLAPFQDLAYFTEPTPQEMSFLETQHEEFHAVLEELARPVDSADQSLLTQWVWKRVHELEGDKWAQFVDSQPDLAAAFIRFLWKMHLPLPHAVELSDALRQAPLIDDWMLIIEDFALKYLKTSARREDHELYAHIKDAIRKLGYGLTEQGIRRQASPVDRVLAHSRNKPLAVAEILELEHRNLEDRLRAVVVTDFEQMSATTVSSLKGVLTAESGGALAVLRELLAAGISQYVNPCLVTGSLLLVDRRVTAQFVQAAREYLHKEGFSFELIVREETDAPYSEITAGVSDWETRLYVGLATEIFERGIVRCLIGTRGIFGEGWDSQSLNTLIDLTTTTSPVSVKQLRGRSIRLNTSDPLGARKVANNWDVVCIAPSLEKGLNDYLRFARKHAGYYGISDDGHIECGVGHVHPSFSELTPAEVFASAGEFNKEMMVRALAREKIYELWKVGQPYNNRELGCVEVGRLRKFALTPPHIRTNMKYKPHARQLRAALNGVWWEHAGLGSVSSAVLIYLLSAWGVPAFAAVLPFLFFMELGRRRHRALYERLKQNICRPNTQESSLHDFAAAVLSSLKELKQLPRSATSEDIQVSVRADGSYRIFLDGVSAEHSRLFAGALKEVLGPVSNQPFLIPKYEYSFPRAKTGDDSEDAFFKAYLAGRAEPRIASYHAVPKIIARSEKGRRIFEDAWNKYVSPGFIVATQTKPELLERYFGAGPSISERLLWT